MSDPKITAWVIDTAHSTFEFAIRHMRVATVKGAFASVTGEIHHDPDDLSASSVRAEIDMASVDSHSAGRDETLRSDRHFDVERFPTSTFVSRRVEPGDGEGFKVIGDLTLHGVTREVAFDTSHEGVQLMPNDAYRTAFIGRATIRRTDFGFDAGRELPGGGYTVSDEVQLAMFTTCNPKE